MAPLPCVTDLAVPEFEGKLVALGVEKWRAVQILRWVHRRRAVSFDQMTDLSRDLRAKLPKHFRPCRTKLSDRHVSPDGTVKYLLKLDEGDVIETVLIPESVQTKQGTARERRTVCISTQVGCPVQCMFCASGLDGLKRNLSAGEIVEQVLHVQRELPPDERISSVVLMGIGEPLFNYAAVVQALRAWKAPWGAGIGFNRVTLSTVGVLNRVRDLIRDKVTPNLALSLHAPDDKLRRGLMPAMKKATVAEIVQAGREYKSKTKKNVTFEYVLLGGVNDRAEHARELARLVRGTRCKVNVIPYNPVEGLPYHEPSKEGLDRFVAELGGGGVPVTVRRRRGDDVAAACGQLRAQVTGRCPTKSST